MVAVPEATVRTRAVAYDPHEAVGDI